MNKDVKVTFEVLLTDEELNNFWNDKGVVINKENTINIIVYRPENLDNLDDLIYELKFNKSINFKKGLDNRVNIDYILERLENIKNE